MIASMYDRRAKAAWLVTAVIFLITVIILLIDWPDSSNDWGTIASIGFVGLAMAGVAMSSRSKYNEVKDIHIPETAKSIMELDHLVLKKDVGFFPRLLLFEKQGHYVGTVKPLHIPFFLYPVSFLLRDSLIMMIPLRYGVFSYDGTLLFTLKRTGMKDSRVHIYDPNGENIGVYVQEDFRSVTKVKGRLKDEEGQVILPVEMKGFSGDFSLFDEDGEQWAHFYNGYFPHTYTTLFRDMDNDIVDIKEDLSQKNKTLLLAMICYVFLERSR
ncbi:hypothetical protein [Alteribacillus iranensis]|nr:hypothetical protein [Alteribacillus iranensis]